MRPFKADFLPFHENIIMMGGHLLYQNSTKDAFYIVDRKKLLREVIFCFLFIDMAIKIGNETLLKRQGGHENQVINFMRPYHGASEWW